MNLRTTARALTFSLILGYLSGQAQTCNPLRPLGPWQGSIEALAGGEARASMATLDYSEVGAPTATPTQRFKHGSDCFIAASRALEINNPVRAHALLSEAKAALLQARAQLTTQRAISLRARSAYLLGLIAERHELDLHAAEGYFSEAVQLSPENADATDALERVRKNLAFRATLGS